MPYRRKRRVYRKRYGRRGRMYKKRYRRKRGVFRSGPPQGGTTVVRSRWGYKNANTDFLPGILMTKHLFINKVRHTTAVNMVFTEYLPNDLFNVFGTMDAKGASVLVPIYDKWVVTGFSYRVTFVNLNVENAYRCMVFPSFKDQDPSTGSQLAQQAGTRTKILAPLGSGAPVVMSGYCNLNKLTGLKLVDAAGYYGSGTSGPTSSFVVRFYVGTQNIQGSDTTQDVSTDVKLVLYTKWFERLMETEVTDVSNEGGVAIIRSHAGQQVGPGNVEIEMDESKDETL